jgi:hypothetical protein
MIGWKVNDDDQYTGTNIQALSGIWTQSLSVQAIIAFASDRTVTGTSGSRLGPVIKYLRSLRGFQWPSANTKENHE